MSPPKTWSDAEEGACSLAGSSKAGGVRARLARRLPVLRWGPRYGRLAAAGDLVAGLTLGLMLVPQSIAYAALADLPVQYGLYSAFMGTMLYTVLGTVKEVSIGPTSLMALLTLQTVRGLPLEFMVLLTFLSGCVVTLMGLLRLGGLVELISPSVTSGFTSATAVIIVVSQLKGLLGLRFTAETLWENAAEIYYRIHLVRYPDLILGTICCAVLLLLRKLKDVKLSPKRAALRKTLWFISIGRNALVVLGASVFAYCTCDPKNPIIKLSGVVEPGLPPLSVPAFSVSVDNSTLSFGDMVQRLGSGVVMVPVVMVLANIAIAKAFTSGGRVDATQEMLTLGLCNVAGSFVRAMPACGAFTRSAVSHSSGVRSPAAGLYSGVITLLALAFMTDFFYFIPTACLSSVLICAVIFMVDISTVTKLWRESKSELGVLALTFAVGVARTVELSVLAGALASLALLLRRLMQQPLHTHSAKWGAGRCVRVVPALSLLYLNAERFAARALRAAARLPRAPVLLDCQRLALFDHSAAQVVSRLAKKLQESDRQLIPYGAWGSVARQLARVPELEQRALRCSTLAAAHAALFTGAAPPLANERTSLLPLASPHTEECAALLPAPHAAPPHTAECAALLPAPHVAPPHTAECAALLPAPHVAPPHTEECAALLPAPHVAPPHTAECAALLPAPHVAPPHTAECAALLPAPHVAPPHTEECAALLPAPHVAPPHTEECAALLPAPHVAPPHTAECAALLPAPHVAPPHTAECAALLPAPHVAPPHTEECAALLPAPHVAPPHTEECAALLPAPHVAPPHTAECAALLPAPHVAPPHTDECAALLPAPHVAPPHTDTKF